MPEHAAEEGAQARAYGGCGHMPRPRVNEVLARALKSYLAVVCAGAGCGKTRAVLDFVRENGAAAAWVQLSARDNVPSRFWKNYTDAMAKADAGLAGELAALGFPDSGDKLERCISALGGRAPGGKLVTVLDDFHLIENPDIIRLIERLLKDAPPNRALVLICRDFRPLNIAAALARGIVSHVCEDDLNFTEAELGQYLRAMGSPVSAEVLREIFKDTGGWAFSVSLVAMSLKKAPGYRGYVSSAMRRNIFRAIEAEVWEAMSENLKNFLARVSLVDYLSAELAHMLAGGDDSLFDELERQNAYVRLDCGTNAYLIHHLFLNFLRTKQGGLTEAEKNGTYQKAAEWSRGNGFISDALSYYEKTGDYGSAVSLLLELSPQLPKDISLFAAEIFGRAPEAAALETDLFAVTHIRAVMYLGRWEEALGLIGRYRKLLAGLPEGGMRERALGGIYYMWGNMRILACTADGVYDFDACYGKMAECLQKAAPPPGAFDKLPLAPWVNLAGSPREGAPGEFMDALGRSVAHLSACAGTAMAGVADLCRGELLFYQGDARAAEPLIMRALALAREHGQYTTEYMALFYLLRLAVLRGRYAKAERALADMEAQLGRKEFYYRFTTYDIAAGWYHCALRQPGLVPEWLKDGFAPYSHAAFIDNFGNQIKARYCFLTKNYPFLLSYMEGMKNRESVLFGRVEMLAMEACARFKMKHMAEAMSALREAYGAARGNGIVMPFIELGKDMRTLTSSALRAPPPGIPERWLEDIGRKASSYAKHQSRVINDCRAASGEGGEAFLSAFEQEIINDLCHGLSRSEIAASHNLSPGIVKLSINNIYKKLNANSLADLIRIITERKLA